MLRKVHKKQIWTPPSAQDYNAMAMAGERYLAGPDNPPERQQPVNPCTAWIKNSSGAARRQFECLELAITPQLDDVTRENIWINGIEADDGSIPFAVLLRPVPDTKWELGQVAGICPALVDIQDITHRWAYLPIGEYVLESTEEANADVCIVQHPAALGEQLCVILFAPPAVQLVELCLKVQHPGQGAVFACYLGRWDPATNNWGYDSCSREVTAIDHRFDVPYPAAGATGLFIPRPSDTYGTIYECVSLDCSSPGPCCPA